MRLMTRIQWYIIMALAIALAVTVVYFRYLTGQGGVTRKIVDTPALVQQIQQLNELVTVKYTIQKVIGLEEEKIPFGSEKVLLMVQATVKAGIDLGTLTTQQVTCASNSVSIQLPSPKITDVYVNEKETQVWDRSKTWWTPWVGFNRELEQKARVAALESAQAAAIEMGIISNAQQNAQIAIRELLRAAGVKDVTFQAAK